MATEEEIFKGLVSVEVTGTNAIEQVADMVETIRAKLSELGATDVELGNFKGGSTSEIDAAIKRLREYQTEMKSVAQQNITDAKSMGAVAEVDIWRKQLADLKEVQRELTAVARLTREVKAAQADARSTAGMSPEQAQLAELQRENERLRAAGAGGNGAPPRGPGGVPTSPEEEPGGYRPRPALDLDAQARSALPDETVLNENALAVRMSRASRAYDDAAAGLERSYKTQAAADAAENRYLAALEQLIRASQNLAKANDKEAAAAEKAAAAEEARQAGAASPLHALLAQDDDAFLQAQGLDPNMPASRLKNAKALQTNADARAGVDAEIAAAQTNGATEAELTKLVAKRTQLLTQQVVLTDQQNRLLQQEEAAARGKGGFLGGLLTQDKETGSLGSDLAGQAGITLKYFALYSAFSAVETGLREVIRQAEQFSLAVNQLSIAMNTSTDEAAKSAQQYVDIGAQYGVDPIIAIQSATKVGRTFANPDGSWNDAAARTGAQLGSIIGTLDPKEEQQNTLQDTIAVAKSFDISAQGLMGVYNQMLTVAQKYGYQTVGEVAPGVAQVSDIGKESGFSIPELTALVTTVMQRTGETSDGAAGDLKRVLGSENATAWTGLEARYNIDMSKSFNDRITQLAEAMRNVPQDERTRELSSLGGPRIAAAIQAIFDGRTQANNAVADANSKPGNAEEQAQKKLESLGGEFQKFGGELQSLFLMLAESGVGDALGALVVVATDVVTVLRTILEGWDQLPGVIKDTATALALLAAAAKVQAMLGGGGGRGGIVDRALGGGYVGRHSGLIEEGATVAEGAAGAEGAAAAGAVAEGAATGFGALVSSMGALLAAAAPLAIALGAIAGVAWLINRESQIGSASSQAADANKAAKDALASGDPSKIADALSSVQGAKKALDDAGVKDPAAPGTRVSGRPRELTGIPGTPDPNSPEAQKKQAEDNAKALKAWSDHQDALDRQAGTPQLEELFGKNFSGINTGIDILEKRGVGAAEGTDMISQLFDKAPAAAIQSLLHPNQGQKGLADLQKQVMTQIAAVQDPTAQTSQYGNLANVLGQAKTQIEGTGNAADIASITLLYNEVNKAWSSAVASTTKMRIDALNSNFTGDTGPIKAALTEALNQTTKAGDVNATIQLMNGANKAFLDQYIAGLEAEKKALDDQRAALVEAATDAQRMVGSSADIRAEQRGRQIGDAKLPDDSAINAQIDAAKKAMGLATPGGQDFAQQLALQQAQIEAGVTEGSSHSAAKAAVDSAQAKLDSLKGKEGTADYYSALKALNDAKYALAQNELAGANAAGSVKVDPGNNLAQAKDAVAVAKRNLDFAVKGTQEYDVAQKAYNDAVYALAQAQLGFANAQLGASEIPGDPQSAATIAVQQTIAAMKGTNDPTTYWNLQKQLNQSKYDLAKIDLENATARQALATDLTDPVVQARNKLDEANRQLAFDRQRGAGTDVTLQDQVNAKQASNDYAGAKFQQQFSDQRTAYDLYREPLSAYLSYLRSQHNYLTAIRDKTRQQTDELNQVDEALKGLTEGLQGQWNLGDIKVPTAYEMRRQLQGGMGSAPNVSYVTITMNGSSTAEMTAALQAAIGQPVMQTVGTTPVKV